MVVPMFLTMFWNSSSIVELAFGEQWLRISEFLPLMLLIGVFRASGNPGGAVLYAKGKANIAFYWNIIFSFCLFSILYVVASKSSAIDNIVFWMVIVYIVSNYLYHLMLQKFVGMPMKIVYKQLFKVTLEFGALSGIIYLTCSLLLTGDIFYWGLLISEVLGLVSYWFYKRQIFKEIL